MDAEVEKQVEADVALYGIGFTVAGKRVDPSTVVIFGDNIVARMQAMTQHPSNQDTPK